MSDFWLVVLSFYVGSLPLLLYFFARGGRAWRSWLDRRFP